MPSIAVRTLRASALLLAAFVLAAAAPTALACDYDFTFSFTGAGDVQIDVDVDCDGHPIFSTSLSGSPGHVGTLVYDSHASIVVPRKPGKNRNYCGFAESIYDLENGIYVLDFGAGECAAF
jgi:hypothetical protein